VALEIMEKIILADRSGLGVMAFNWRALARFLPTASSPKFSEIARHASWDGEDEDDLGSLDIRRLLEEQSDEELKVTFTEMIRAEIGKILHLSPDKIDIRQSLFDMGLDSLMGMELLMAMEGRFGIQLPTITFTEDPSIERLAERILHHLRGAADDQMPDAGTIQVPSTASMPLPNSTDGGQNLIRRTELGVKPSHHHL
jgi:acyl carrier protein